MTILKDEQLVEVARLGNVAQFASFDPACQPRHARITGVPEDHAFNSVSEAIGALLAVSPEGSVNVRAYSPESPRGNEFLYGITLADDATAHVRRLAGMGLFTIVNETVDIHDGGVSGVALGEVVEIIPGDTPRGVEKSGVAQLPRAAAIRMLETVYSVRPELPQIAGRVEFSLHPLRRGYRRSHTIVWEVDAAAAPAVSPALRWPNRFSMTVGDKVFGLLCGELLGQRVPRGLVIARTLAPFSFGSPTGMSERWLRTCPRVSTPGRFTTVKGWTDPFVLMAAEDANSEVAAILVQDAVDARFSGASISQTEGGTLIEGVGRSGEDFMLGRRAPESLPERVQRDVRGLHDALAERLGTIHIEWAHDGAAAWLLQLRQVAPVSSAFVIVPGTRAHFRRFDVTRGLEALRAEVASARGRGEGIELVGDVGVTSHFGDILRQARVPSRLIPAASEVDRPMAGADVADAPLGRRHHAR